MFRRKKKKVIKLQLEVEVKEPIEILEVGVMLGELFREIGWKYRYSAFYGIEGLNKLKFEDFEEDEEEEEGAIPPDNHFEFKGVI